MRCEDVLLHVARHGTLPPGGEVHVAVCPECTSDVASLAALAPGLAATPTPPPGLAIRAAAAAAPLLARRGTRPAWHQVGRALAVALPALPLVVALNWWTVTTVYALLEAVLPAPLPLWLVGQYALLAALLVTLGYAAVPVVAAHQRPLEDGHA